MLEVKNLSCGYNGIPVLENVNFTANSGDIICLLGSNGSGKSTLIKTIVGLLKPFEGEILAEGKNIRGWSYRKRAKLISYIPQTFSSGFQYKSIDIVLMGRTSYLGFASAPSKKDEEIAEKALETLNIMHLRDKIYSQLSGGERQLVKIAQALTQQTKIIVMDEPVNNLDFGNQITILEHLKECRDLGMTIIMATHSPEHAFLYADKALLTQEGQIIEIEKPNKNLTEENLKSIYNVELEVVELDWKDNTVKICLPGYSGY